LFKLLNLCYLANSRIYINRNEEPGRSFYTDGILDTSKISKFPALLVTEPGGTGVQFAKVAHITQIVQEHKETVIQYAIDNSIAPISNSDLENYPAELRLGNFGLSHTHWKLCDADLYKLLLHNQQKTSIKPKVFSIDAAYTQDRDLVSVMMPFSAEFNAVYTALKASTDAIGLSCVRADDIWEDHAIIQDVVNIIARARVVICDCSGKNPNVFYEAGIAHTLGKEVILIAQSKEDIPFDLRHLRYICYLSNTEGFESLSQLVQSRLRSIIGL
jgi:hypothetical protein